MSGLAVLHSHLLPMVRQCIYKSITVTDSNISKLIRTSRKLRYINLLNARSVILRQVGPSVLDLYHEVVEHLRPISFSLRKRIWQKSLELIDVDRLRELTIPFEYSGSIFQRVSATLERLTLTLGSGGEALNLPRNLPSMTALKHLNVDDVSGATVHVLPNEFHRFLRNCKALCTLTIFTEDPTVAEMVIGICGKTITVLELYIGLMSYSRQMTIGLASLAPYLHTLRLWVVDLLFLLPYPQSLRRLEYQCISVETASELHTALAGPSFPRIRFLLVDIDCHDDEGGESAEEVKTVRRQLAAECGRLGIEFRL